jgi:hypothetical protein
LDFPSRRYGFYKIAQNLKKKTGNLFTLDVLGVPGSVPSGGLQFTLTCGTLCPPGPICHSNKRKIEGDGFLPSQVNGRERR